MMTSHIYLLRDLHRHQLKIGKANDILSRARSFNFESIDFADSLGFLVDSETDAYRLERILHRTFHAYRIDSTSILSGGGPSDGASEWFDANCKNRVLRFLDENQDLYPHSIINGSDLSKMVQDLVKMSACKLERNRLKNELDERRAQRRAAEKAKIQSNIGFVEEQVLRIKCDIRNEVERLNATRSIVGIYDFSGHTTLVLADNATLDKEPLWSLELQDTMYKYEFGGGSIITGISQISLLQGRLCYVDMSFALAPASPPETTIHGAIQRVFSTDIEWLRRFPIVSADIASSIRGFGPNSEELAEQLIGEHLARL